jgi:hypothetical protein
VCCPTSDRITLELQIMYKLHPTAEQMPALVFTGVDTGREPEGDNGLLGHVPLHGRPLRHRWLPGRVA